MLISLDMFIQITRVAGLPTELIPERIVRLSRRGFCKSPDFRPEIVTSKAKCQRQGSKSGSPDMKTFALTTAL